MKVLVSTAPFGLTNTSPITLLEKAGIDFSMNPFGRKMSEDELAEMIGEYDCLIAGTESISRKVLNNATRLKLIARVGIGLDSVDLAQAQKQKIRVTYTPDAPSSAVSELTVALMLSTLRSVHISNNRMHNYHWERFLGRRLSESVIGVIGIGRIGSRVIEHLSGFKCKRVLGNDTDPLAKSRVPKYVTMVDKDIIYREADVITIHVPLTGETRGMIDRRQFEMFKKTSILINTARGGIVVEKALRKALVDKKIFAAAIDTFENEPYKGSLCGVKQCLLTSHMGSMSEDCRERMELEATQEVVRLAKGQSLAQEVPRSEYHSQELLFRRKEG